MNDGISQLEKLANVQREKKKKLLDDQGKEKNKKEQEMQMIKENKKRENNKREEEAKKDGRRGGGGSKVPENVIFNEQQKKEMEDIVRQRNEYEIKHREIRFEREKVSKELQTLQFSLSALKLMKEESSGGSGESGGESGGGSGESGDVVEKRKHYAAVGKSFVVKRSIDLVEGMVGEEKEMMERLLILKKRDDTCVSKLEGIQNELEEIVGRLEQ